MSLSKSQANYQNSLFTCFQVGAVDSSYDAHDDSDAPVDALTSTPLGGAAAFTTRRLQGRDTDAQ